MGIVRRKNKLRAGGGTDDGYIGTVDVKRYNFYYLFFSLFSAVRDSFSSEPLLLLPLLFCRGGCAGGNLRFRKNSLPSGSGHGEKVFWGGCGAAAGKCATKIPGVAAVWQLYVTSARKTCR